MLAYEQGKILAPSQFLTKYNTTNHIYRLEKITQQIPIYPSAFPCVK